jgi:DNA-binding transcriptional MerR regulator
MRIGELATAVGTTPRTVRYYEEIGLIPGPADRESGGHRVYTEDDAEQLRELLRLKHLLGVSLEELRELVEDQQARAVLREEFRQPQTSVDRRLRILTELDGVVARQRELVARRRTQLDQLDAELIDRQSRIAGRRRELDDARATP